MDKIDYLLTANGSFLRFIHRMSRGIELHFKEEPLSKKSMNAKKKRTFQQEVISQLRIAKRKGFLASTKICVYIRIHTSSPNPPHIHQIPKNYLDLLTKPVSKDISRKKILFDDDKQVKCLSIDYYIGNDSDSSIMIYIYPFDSLIEDIKLARAFQKGQIKSENQRLNIHEDEDDERFWDSLKEYQAFIKRKGKIPELDKVMEYIYLHSVQDNFLKEQEKLASSLYELLSLDDYNYSLLKCCYKNEPSFLKLISDIHDPVKSLTEQALYNIMFSPISISLPSLPTKEGQSAGYKSLINKRMVEYKKGNPYLTPLLIPVNIKVFYKAPLCVGFNKDLDNIMRIIVPIFHDIFNPPVSTILINDFNLINDGTIKEYRRCTSDIPKSIQTQIAGYEIIEIPRASNDTSDGYLQIILCNPFFRKLSF